VGNHSRPGTYSKLGEDPAHVRAHSPGTDIQNVGDNFVGVSQRNQPHDFPFARSELHRNLSRLWEPEKQVARTIHNQIENDLLALKILPNLLIEVGCRPEIEESANEVFDADHFGSRHEHHSTLDSPPAMEAVQKDSPYQDVICANGINPDSWRLVNVTGKYLHDTIPGSLFQVAYFGYAYKR
jgi:hypothetical protein